MAAINDSDESFEEISEDRGDYLRDVIKDALKESSEGLLYAEEISKSMKTENSRVRGISHQQTAASETEYATSASDFNSHDNVDEAKSHECQIIINIESPKNDERCNNFDDDMSILRKSQSDDVLSSRSTPREGRDRGAPVHLDIPKVEESGKSLYVPKMCEEYKEPINEYAGVVREKEQDDDIDEYDDDEDDENFEAENIDFFREYDRKIDVLECCDYALEESFIRLREHIEMLCNYGIEEGITETAGKEDVRRSEAEDEADGLGVSGAEAQKVGSLLNSKTPSQSDRITTNLHQAMLELQGRFERFISEVGETVQLGALAAKHSQRVEKWAGEIQSTYATLKNDHQKLQCYIDVKEREWIRAREVLQTEISYHGEQIQDLAEGIKNNDELRQKTEKTLYKKLGDRMVRRPINPDKLSTEETLIDFLIQKRFDEEQALALDFSRRMKISELKLVVLQQQSYIQKIELQNKELDGILRGLLYNPENEQVREQELTKQDEEEKCYELKYSDPVAGKISQVSEVVRCDQSVYLPGRSTNPDIVGDQVFNMGEGTPSEDGNHSPFDPTKLHYIKTFTADQVLEEDVTEDGDQADDITKQETETGERGSQTTNVESVSNSSNMACYTDQSGEPNGSENQVLSLSAQSRKILERNSTAIPAV